RQHSKAAHDAGRRRHRARLPGVAWHRSRVADLAAESQRLRASAVPIGNAAFNVSTSIRNCTRTQKAAKERPGLESAPAADVRCDAKMPSTQHRRDSINALSTEAERLSKIATDRNLRRFIESARRDADEAQFWLEQPNVEGRPPILHIVDLIL